MRILLVGMRYFGTPDNGAERHVYHLANELRYAGHYVEIFSATLSYQQSLPTLCRVVQNGIVLNMFNDDKGVIYQDFENPINEVYDEKRENLFREFLTKNSDWDIIHFHHMMPLSLHAIAKEMGFKVIITMHDLYIVDPTVHFISEKQFSDNSFSDVSHKSVSAEHFADEYLFLSKNSNIKLRRDDIVKQMEDRISYGKHILSDVVDKVYINGPWVLIIEKYYGLHFSIKNMETLPMRSEDTIFNDISYESKNKLVNDGIVTFALLGYFAPRKAQHILLKAIEYLKDYKGKFKIIFFGRFYDYMLSNGMKISEYIKSNPFIEEHIEIRDSYDVAELDLICKEFDINMSPGISITTGGATVKETVLRGKLTLITSDFLSDYLKVHTPPIDENTLKLKNFIYLKRGNSKFLADKMKHLIDNQNDIYYYRDIQKTIYRSSPTRKQNYSKNISDYLNDIYDYNLDVEKVDEKSEIKYYTAFRGNSRKFFKDYQDVEIIIEKDINNISKFGFLLYSVDKNCERPIFYKEYYGSLDCSKIVFTIPKNLLNHLFQYVVAIVIDGIILEEKITIEVKKYNATQSRFLYYNNNRGSGFITPKFNWDIKYLSEKKSESDKLVFYLSGEINELKNDTIVSCSNDIELNFNYTVNSDKIMFCFGIRVSLEDGTVIFDSYDDDTKQNANVVVRKAGTYLSSVVIPSGLLFNGIYNITVFYGEFRRIELFGTIASRKFEVKNHQYSQFEELLDYDIIEKEKLLFIDKK